MRASRRDELLKGQTGLARKVYDAIPIRESWDMGDIMAEVIRLGHQMPVSNARAAVLALVDAGLVTEPKRDIYRRVGVRGDDNQPEEKAPMPNVTTPSEATKSPLQVLEALARRAIQISELARTLAGDIETAALNIQHNVEMTAEDQQKFAALKSLLKSIA